MIGIGHPVIGDRHHSEHEVYLEQGARDRGSETAEAVDPLGDEQDDDHDATNRQDEEGDMDHDALDPRQDEEHNEDQNALDPRRDIQARLRRAPHVIIADTYANRPDRTRRTVTKYQAGDTKKVAKRLGRGRGPGRGRGRGGGGAEML